MREFILTFAYIDKAQHIPNYISSVKKLPMLHAPLRIGVVLDSSVSLPPLLYILREILTLKGATLSFIKYHNMLKDLVRKFQRVNKVSPFICQFSLQTLLSFTTVHP